MPKTVANIAHGAALAERALPVGTVLSGDQFTITGQLGAGGFGITYRAKDNVLGRTAVIKECFPEDFCIRDGKNVIARNNSLAKPVRSIIKMFMREARSLAKLRHPNIVGVHRAFEENETAYMALDLIDGRDLFNILKAEAAPLSPGRVKNILLQLLDAIDEVHKVGLLHRDISPDNIIIEKTGTPVLIDFGAARGDASRHTRAISSLLVVKDGYSPQEFYVAGSEQAPSSDLYALAATFYHVLSGTAPTNSQTRMIEIVGHKPDPCVPLVGRIDGYDREFLQAIDSAMQIHPGDRLQSAAKWRSLISDVETDSRSLLHSGTRATSNDISLELEQSLSRLVEETNDEVRRTSQIPVEPEVEKVALVKESKPDWVEEFNQESLVPANKSDTAFVETEVSQDTKVDASEFQESTQTPVTHLIPDPTHPEQSWINRALEKQERIRSEREAALKDFEQGVDGRDGSTASKNPTDVSDNITEEAIQAKDAPKAKNLPMRILVGLLVCFSFAVFFDSP